MKFSTFKLSFLTFLICLCFSAKSFTQPPGWSFNPQTVTTVSGKVAKVEQITPTERMGVGIHLILNTNEGDISVHLGPSGYLSQEGLIISENDELKVTGSKVTFNDHTILIASKVEKEGKVHVLRDDYGVPMWSGRYR